MAGWVLGSGVGGRDPREHLEIVKHYDNLTLGSAKPFEPPADNSRVIKSAKESLAVRSLEQKAHVSAAANRSDGPPLRTDIPERPQLSPYRDIISELRDALHRSSEETRYESIKLDRTPRGPEEVRRYQDEFQQLFVWAEDMEKGGLFNPSEQRAAAEELIARAAPVFQSYQDIHINVLKNGPSEIAFGHNSPHYLSRISKNLENRGAGLWCEFEDNLKRNSDAHWYDGLGWLFVGPSEVLSDNTTPSIPLLHELSHCRTDENLLRGIASPWQFKITAVFGTNPWGSIDSNYFREHQSGDEAHAFYRETRIEIARAIRSLKEGNANTAVDAMKCMKSSAALARDAALRNVRAVESALSALAAGASVIYGQDPDHDVPTAKIHLSDDPKGYDYDLIVYLSGDVNKENQREALIQQLRWSLDASRKRARRLSAVEYNFNRMNIHGHAPTLRRFLIASQNLLRETPEERASEPQRLNNSADFASSIVSTDKEAEAGYAELVEQLAAAGKLMKDGNSHEADQTLRRVYSSIPKIWESTIRNQKTIDGLLSLLEYGNPILNSENLAGSIFVPMHYSSDEGITTNTLNVPLEKEIPTQELAETVRDQLKKMQKRSLELSIKTEAVFHALRPRRGLDKYVSPQIQLNALLELLNEISTSLNSWREFISGEECLIRYFSKLGLDHLENVVDVHESLASLSFMQPHTFMNFVKSTGNNSLNALYGILQNSLDNNNPQMITIARELRARGLEPRARSPLSDKMSRLRHS